MTDELDDLTDPTEPPEPGVGQERRDSAPSREKPAPPAGPAARLTARQRLERGLTRLRRLREESPSRFYVLMAAAASGLLVVVVIVSSLMHHQRPPQVRATGGEAVFQSRDASDVKSFIERSSRDLEDMTKNIQHLTEESQRLRKQAEDDAAEHQARVDELRKQIEQLRSAQPAQRATPLADGRAQPAIAFDRMRDELRSLQSNGLITAETARDRLRAWMKQNDPNMSSTQIEALLPGLLDRIGILNIDNVAEPPATDAEIASLPEALRPLVDVVRDYHYSRALAEGRVSIDIPHVRREIANRHIDAAQYTDEDVMRLGQIARVRREKVPAEFEAALPRLVGLRESRSIDRGDLAGIEQLLWENRELLPGATGGQLATMAYAVARAGGPADVGKAFDPATPEDVEFARRRVRQAIDTAMSLNIRDDRELLKRATAALERFLEDSRKHMSKEDKSQLLIAEVSAAARAPAGVAAAATESASAGPAAGRPASAAAGAPQQRTGEQAAEPTIVVGGLALNRQQARYVAWLLVPMVGQRLKLDPDTAEGAASITTLWASSGSVSDTAFDAVAGQPLSARHWLDEVLRVDSDLSVSATTLVSVEMGLATIPESQREIVTAAIVGTLVGPHLGDAASADAALRALRQRAQRGAVLGDDAMADLAATPPPTGLRRLAIIYAGLIPGGVPCGVDRVDTLARLVTSGLLERQTVMRKVAAAPALGTAAPILAREIDEALPVVVAGTLALRDDRRIQPDDLERLVDAGTVSFAAASIGEGSLMSRLTQQVMRTYAASVEGGRDGFTTITRVVGAWAADAVAETFRSNHPALDDRTFIDVGVAVATGLLPEGERRVIVELLMLRTEPQIRRAGETLDPHVVEAALADMREVANRLASPPYSPKRMDEWSLQMQQQGNASLRGQRLEGGKGQAAVAKGKPTTSDGKPDPRSLMPKSRDYKGPTSTTRAPVGVRSTILRGRNVVIPQGTYANAIITGGVTTEVGGRGNRPVLLEMPMMWKGPGASYLVMPKVRLLGEADPLPGPERNAITLKKFSYVFPNGRAVSKTINGYVVDNVTGMEGALGTFKLNADKVLPPALLSGFLQGAGEAATSPNTTTVVSTGSTTTTSDRGSPLQRALLGGTGEAAGIVNEFVRTYLNSIKPTVETPNGQPVTVVLQDDIVFDDLSQDEWTSLTYRRSSAGF